MLWCVNWFFASVRKTFENCSVYPYIVGIFFCVSLYLWLLNLGRILPLWKPLLPCTWFNACAHVYLLTMPCLAEWLVGYMVALFLFFLDITVHWLMADNWTTVLPRPRTLIGSHTLRVMMPPTCCCDVWKYSESCFWYVLTSTQWHRAPCRLRGVMRPSFVLLISALYILFSCLCHMIPHLSFFFTFSSLPYLFLWEQTRCVSRPDVIKGD